MVAIVKFKERELRKCDNERSSHHKAMLNNGRKFVSDTACPKCGEFSRKYTDDKYNTSHCICCQNKSTNKNDVNKKAVDIRRAIELHQQKKYLDETFN